MNEEYDFYGMGERHANETIMEIRKLALELEKQYGPDARMEFEAGVSVSIPAYANVIETSQFSIADMEGSTKQYGVEGTRNNSYFGYKGTSYQTDSYGRYNEPKGRSK